MAFVRRLLNGGARSKKADNPVNGAVSSGSKMSTEEDAAASQMAGLSLQNGEGDSEIATFAMS